MAKKKAAGKQPEVPGDRVNVAVLCDMDGVIIWDNKLIEGAKTFVEKLIADNVAFLFITNYPSLTPADLAHRVKKAGLEVPAEHFYTSAMATATFLQSQRAGDKVFVVGEGALTHALYQQGFTITDQDPDFVVIGETRSYNFEMIEKSIKLIRKGARFIATNPDVSGPSGFPSCGALTAPIEKVTGKKPFYVGKPNPYMMRAALRRIGSHSENTVMIGDNMETDIIAGIQAGMDTILVLSGVTGIDDIDRYPYRPSRILANVGEIGDI
jgi:NagD protein